MDSNSDDCAALQSQNEQLREQLRQTIRELDELRSTEVIRQVTQSDELESATRRYREETESLRTAQSILQESIDELKLVSDARQAEARTLAELNAKLIAELETLRSRSNANVAAAQANSEQVRANEETDVSSGNSPTTGTGKFTSSEELSDKIRGDKLRDELETWRRQLENERNLTTQLRKLCISLLPNLNAESQFAHLLVDSASQPDAPCVSLVRVAADSPVQHASSASLAAEKGVLQAKAHSVDRDGLSGQTGPSVAAQVRGVAFELGCSVPPLSVSRRRGSWPSAQLDDLHRLVLASSRVAKQPGDACQVAKSVAQTVRKAGFDTCSLQGDLSSTLAAKALPLLQKGSYSSRNSLSQESAEKKTELTDGESEKLAGPLAAANAAKFRQISEREYENLQLESHRARTREATRAHIIDSKLANYEAQVQSLQSKVKALTAKLSDTEGECEAERKQRNELENQVRVLNEQLGTLNETATRSLQALTDRAEEHERIVRELDETYKSTKAELRAEFSKLRFDREAVTRQMERLKRENESLTAIHSQLTVEMQAERINLPTAVDDCHTMLLRFIDELIMLKTNKRHTEEDLRTENMFLRERLEKLEKQAAANNREKETEQNERQELTAFVESLKMELERECKLRRETEQRFKEGETTNRDANAKLRAARRDVEQLKHDRDRLQEEVSRNRQRVAQLQQELTTSESVQRDFVRLSQSLQIELEKLRQADTDVRWQNDEDAHECSACRAPFSAQAHKSKQHCRHCGKVYCNECLSKTVPSGPNRRPARVCDVCHTLLCKDAQPYFSRTPPSGVH